MSIVANSKQIKKNTKVRGGSGMDTLTDIIIIYSALIIPHNCCIEPPSTIYRNPFVIVSNLIELVLLPTMAYTASASCLLTWGGSSFIIMK